MSRFKALGILLVVGLIALLISLTVALAQGAHGTVTIRDSDDGNYSDKLSDMAIIDLNLPPLGPDEVYEGWLVTDGKDRAQSTGILVQDDDGNVSQTYTSTGDKAGENLFSVFDKFVISIEPVPDPDPGPSANNVRPPDPGQWDRPHPPPGLLLAGQPTLHGGLPRGYPQGHHGRFEGADLGRPGPCPALARI